MEQTVRKKDPTLAKKQAELQQTQGKIVILKYGNDLLSGISNSNEVSEEPKPVLPMSILIEVYSVAVTVSVFWCLLWGFIGLCAFHYYF